MVRRILRFLFTLLFAVVGVVLTVGIVLQFNPGWQRDLIEASLEERTGMEWSMEEAYFSFPAEFRATELFALQGGEGIQAAQVTLHLDVGRSLSAGRRVIAEGEIRRLFLDLSSAPPDAIGFTSGQLAHGMPSRDETLQAVSDLTELALFRVEAAGLSLECNDLEVQGQVLLPGNRRLDFGVLIRHALTEDPASMRVEVTAAEFR